jgi:hypothetical protein
MPKSRRAGGRAGSLSVARQNGARTNKRALPARGKRGKAAGAGTFDAPASPPFPPPPTLPPSLLPPGPGPAPRAVRRYGIFAERLFLIDAIQTSRPPGALVKLFVAFRAASRDIRSSGFTRPGARIPRSLSSRKNTHGEGTPGTHQAS